ncbi:DUF4177 domain-containing protein [Yoonia sediminilitoris]|nr:DUF4177 domain-containing protein [Yoonia sediminilitoris]
MTYEYKVVPAPTRGLKAKGVKTAEDRFANALQTAMNDLAADGWEYQRTDTLPCEQREGLMSKTTVYQNMLIFRRRTAQAVAAPSARAEPASEKTAVAPPLAQEPALPRTGDAATRPLHGAERLTADDKQQLLKSGTGEKPKKSDVAAE